MTGSVPLKQHSEPRDYLGLGEMFSDFIIVSAQPFTQQNLDRFGATWLLNHAKRVHLVDLSLIIWGKAAVEADQHDAIEEVMKPAGWSDVESLLQQYGHDSLLIPYTTPHFAMPLFELVAKYSLPSLFWDIGRMPDSNTLFRFIVSRAQSLMADPKDLMRRVSNRLSAWEFAIDYLVLSGKDCEIRRKHRWIKQARVTIPSHSYDYGVWQASTPFIHSEPYIVFLDQAYTDHPHWRRLWRVNPFTGGSYYHKIEGFLRHVSDTYGMPVVIALHPRSSDTKGPKPYQGFQMFRDRTASLVKGAKLVVAHDSTAVSFAVLGRKPLLLVEVEERSKRLHIGNVTRNMSAILGAPVVHLSSRALPTLEKFDVDESKYASYEALYIRHPACNGIPVWDRVFGTSSGSPSAWAKLPDKVRAANQHTGQNLAKASQ